MHSLVAGLLFAIIALTIFPAAAWADYGPDCDDFSSSQEAQDYYESQGGLAGGDPDGLDRDQDGQACDWGAPPPDIDWSDSEPSETEQAPNEPARFAEERGFGLPWWAWAGGGIAALWLVALVRWNT